MYKISEENVKELRGKMKREKKANVYRRLQAVSLRGEGKTDKEIAEITGFHQDYVGKLCKVYITGGMDGLLRDGRKGGNHRNMTKAEAAVFLQKFEEKAKSGQIITVEAIGRAYDKTVGKEHKSFSSIYYFLKSHGWRKIMPQKQHPGKANAEAIEASKKLTMNLKK